MRRFRVLSFLLFASPSALGAGTFHASYRAPEECPVRDDFLRAVEQRLPDWRHSDSPGEREMTVVIEKTEAGFKGALTLSPSPQVREVEGPRCDSVMRALALVAAVSLDPNAALAAEPVPDAAPVSPVTPPPAEQEPPPPSPPPVRTAGSSSPSFGFGAGGALLFGPAPSPLYGVDVHAEIGTASRSWIVRILGARTVTGTVSVGTGEAHFQLTHAELGGCYLPIHESVSVMGCLVLDAGSVEAEGEPSSELQETNVSRRFWGAAGARLGFGVRLTGPLELGTSLGVLVPWQEQSYVFDNADESTEGLHQSAPIAVDFRLGISVIFSGDQD